MSFTIVPLLLTGKAVSLEIRQALRDSRVEDAAAMIMREYGLSCVEAGHLLNRTVCDQAHGS